MKPWQWGLIIVGIFIILVSMGLFSSIDYGPEEILGKLFRM